MNFVHHRAPLWRGEGKEENEVLFTFAVARVNKFCLFVQKNIYQQSNKSKRSAIN
jgi:hypothetical protein